MVERCCLALIGGGHPRLHRQMLVSLKVPPPISHTSLLLRRRLQAILGRLACMFVGKTTTRSARSVGPVPNSQQSCCVRGGFSLTSRSPISQSCAMHAPQKSCSNVPMRARMYRPTQTCCLVRYFVQAWIPLLGQPNPRTPSVTLLFRPKTCADVTQIAW